MSKNEQKVEVSNPESISDNALIKDGKRAYLKAFKKWSWNLSWNNKYGGKFFVISLITGSIGMIASIFDAGFSALIGMEDGMSLSVLRSLVSVVLGVGLIGFSFNVAKGLFQKIDDFFNEIKWDRVRKNLIGGLLFGLIVLGGIFLLLIPGIIFSVRFQFFAFAVIDKGLGPVEALKYSWRITKGRFWEIVGFDCYFLLWNIVGMLCLLVGLIWTSAMTNLATARYYRLISNLYDNNLKLGNDDKKA